MLIFDQLKKDDPQLRTVALALLVGLGILLAGLWWVQIVSVRDFRAHLEMQSFRTVRMPAVRGRILDRNGLILAENRPVYNVCLYLEELRKEFDAAYVMDLLAAREHLKRQMEDQQRKLGHSLTKQQKKTFSLSAKDKAMLRQRARFEVASNVVRQISLRLGEPLSLDPTNFQHHYETRLALPLIIVTNLNPIQIAIFSEQCSGPGGAELEIQSTRVYPFTNIAAHVLGSVKPDDSSAEGEDAFFSYRLPDYRGQLGVEFGYDTYLRGRAGVKSVVVNNVGYRQAENIWQQVEPGRNIVLTIDLAVQRKAERALQIYGSVTRGAVVVMDVQTGDLLALASSPTIDPNDYIQGFPPGEIARRKDDVLRPERNRATQEHYAPGSIFKTIVGLACLESGLDPNENLNNPGYYAFHGGGKPIGDLAAPGLYNFKKALVKSSNTYFIQNGLKTGIENIIRLTEHLHLSESTGLHTRQETSGTFPTLKRVGADWYDGNTANICIGQGQMAVTPLQMAVMIAAIANGGKVLWPRLVDRVEPLDTSGGESPIVFETARLRDELRVRAENLKIIREAMLEETQPGGTGERARVPGLDICGKTGTAQVMDQHNKTIAETTWFASFAPFNNPRYSVIVMIETDPNAGTGGRLCAPVAANIYRALLEREKNSTAKIATLN
jgi:penicillin-binding protein 2